MRRYPSRMTASPLRLGILGCANIARGFLRDIAPSPAVRAAYLGE